MSFRHMTSFCILNEKLIPFRFRYFQQNRLLEQIDKNLKFKVIKLRDLKMDLIKWQLNFVSCKFGLKWYLWFQIELTLRACLILKSRVWLQAKLHSAQFNSIIYRACFAFWGGHFEFLISGLLVRSLEPKLRKSETGGKIRKFSEDPIAHRG